MKRKNIELKSLKVIELKSLKVTGRSLYELGCHACDRAEEPKLDRLTNWHLLRKPCQAAWKAIAKHVNKLLRQKLCQ